MKKLSAIITVCAALLAIGCSRAPAPISGRLAQRGYLWQRDWTPAVGAALSEAQRHLQDVVLLGAEIEWIGKEPRIVRANIDWEQVRKTGGGDCALALRVAPFAFPTERDDPALGAISATARSLVAEAHAHDVAVKEFQLDYDCAERNLGAYRRWLPELRRALAPTRFVITTLPSLLENREFVRLVQEVDGYVLQVHSIPLADAGGGRLCDPQRARRWVAQAARLHRPFSVALPTYRCTAGYDPSGRLIGVAMDSVQPAWPPGTRILSYSPDADALADLVKEWERNRPAELQELLWYRIPVASDTRNWRWPTLDAVKAGRKPERHVAIVRAGENPIDLSLVNEGEADEDIEASIAASWNSAELVAADALAGWRVDSQPTRALFTVANGHRLRLPPGASRRIGWLRQRGTTAPTLTYHDETSFSR